MVSYPVKYLFKKVNSLLSNLLIKINIYKIQVLMRLSDYNKYTGKYIYNVTYNEKKIYFPLHHVICMICFSAWLENVLYINYQQILINKAIFIHIF